MSKCPGLCQSRVVPVRGYMILVWFFPYRFLTGFHISNMWSYCMCIVVYIYIYMICIYIYVKGLDIAVYIWDVLFFHVFNVLNVLNVRRRKRHWQKQWRPRPSMAGPKVGVKRGMADVFHGAWNGMSTTSSTWKNCPNVLTHSHIIIWH